MNIPEEFGKYLLLKKLTEDPLGETFRAGRVGKAGIEQALRAYHRINALAVELLEPEGILVTCSCSGNVTRDDFFNMLFGVAQKTRRDLQIIEQHGASPDHPASVLCPETQYLKCFICRVK